MAFGPIEAYYLSKDANKIEAVEKISKQDKDYLLETGKKIWNFFNDTMNEENNFYLQIIIRKTEKK